MPDGIQDKFYVFSGTTPVIILPLTKYNEVVAVRQFRYGANDVVLEIPGGNIKEGETPEDTVRKELLEETGYVSGQIVRLGGEKQIWFDPASFTVAYWSALVFDCQKIQEPKPEKTEIMATVLVPIRKWVEMIAHGEVRDSKTLAVTLLALHYLARI